MCTYNGGRFLPEQLRSISAQKRPPDELVVCDDGSSDDTVSLLEEFSRKATFPVRVIASSKNLGSTENFQKAISLCVGEVVALADQDDVWYPQKLERIEQHLLQFDRCIAVFSEADLIDDNSRSVGMTLWKTVGFDKGEQRRFREGDAVRVMIRRPVVTGATMAFRRKILDLLIPFPREVIHDRWMSLLLSTIGRIDLIPEALMQYRRHSGQQVGVGPRSMRDRLRHARVRGEELYRSEIEFFSRVQAHLRLYPSNFPTTESAVSEIARKLSHLELRLRLHRKEVSRVPNVFRELCNRGYWRYSAGWESVAKDLFLSTH